MGTRKSSVLFMTELALLVAIVIFMAFTPLGYLRVGVVEITFIVIPVAIGAVILGAKAGALLGLAFGLTSFAQCFGMSPFGTMLFNAKPLATAFCCIVPRICVGLVPALVYVVLLKVTKKRTLSIAVSCLLAPLTNTILYLACNVVFFQDYLSEAYGYVGKGGIYFLGWLLALVGVNAILEAISSFIIGTAICNALLRTLNR